MNITPTHIRRRQYVIACRLVALGEQGLYQNFTRLQLRRMAEALPIPEKALHKISHQLGYWGSLDVKPIFTERRGKPLPLGMGMDSGEPKVNS